MSEFSVGDRILIEDSEYTVVGKILYTNTVDNKDWMEYKLVRNSGGGVFWLSYDDCFKEYSISAVGRDINGDVGGYHPVDVGREKVKGAWGNVDVDIGECADFTEYEDITEEYIKSEEVWSDGTEVSYGHYVELSRISLLGHDNAGIVAKRYSGGSSSKGIGAIFAAVFMLLFSAMGVGDIFGWFDNRTAIADFLASNSSFEYKTSITDEKEKADVYKAAYDMDTAAKKIIDMLEGETIDVTQNTEDGDNSIGLLTKYEYCFIYTSEDNEVLVQVSSRKYAYTGRQEPYHSRASSRRYYRRYYYSYGYDTDSSSYKGTSSDYSSYSDSKVTLGDSTTYNTYSSSVRQASAARRASSGGGTSGGK